MPDFFSGFFMLLKKLNSEKGFSLMEIMVAVVITAITLCGILLTYITSFALIKTSKNASMAASAERGLMDEIRNTSFPLIFSTYNGVTFTVNNMPSNKGVIYVDDTNPELLEVTISVSWQEGNKVIGEDTNFNGVLDSGEDLNSDNILNSPVELVTLISNR